MSSRVYVSNFLGKFFVALIVVLLAFNVASAQDKFPTDTLSINSKGNIYDFDIELALDDSHRQYGMMFRTELPEMNGMLFVYDEMRRMSMWMKNTFIPLDIIFIGEDGKITRIAKMAQPRSLSLIRSGGFAKAVLEVNGGLTDKLGIEEGDEIIHSTFGNATK